MDLSSFSCLCFISPRSAAQKHFWQTESQQFLAAESRSSERGSSSRPPCTCSVSRDKKPKNRQIIISNNVILTINSSSGLWSLGPKWIKSTSERRSESCTETDGLTTEKESHSFIIDSLIHNSSQTERVLFINLREKNVTQPSKMTQHYVTFLP